MKRKPLRVPMSGFINWIQKVASADDREAFIVFLQTGRVQIGDLVFTDIMEMVVFFEKKYQRPSTTDKGVPSQSPSVVVAVNSRS